MDAEAVRKIAGGRVWSGQQAVDLKLVDGLGGIGDALALVRKQGKLADDIYVRHVPQGRDLASSLAERLFDSRVQDTLDPSVRLLLAGWERSEGLRALLDDALAGRSSSKVYALLDRCPHRGGPLSQGIVMEHGVACPLHNWTIRFADGCAQAPDEGQTPGFAVMIDDSRVHLDATELASKGIDLPLPCAGPCGKSV